MDYIGEDVYDNTDSVAAAQAEITEMTNFAQVMGLPWSLPEWGMNGPKDDPAFVEIILQRDPPAELLGKGIVL